MVVHLYGRTYMRIKVEFDLISKPTTYEKIQNNQMHAFILSRMSNKFARKQHEQGNYTMFTFGSVRVQHARDKGSFMFSAPDNITEQLIVGMRLNELFRLGNYHCKLNDIREIDDINIKSGKLLLRGRILLSSGDRKQKIREENLVEKYLTDISENKLNILGIKERLDIQVHKVSDTSLYYSRNKQGIVSLPAADVVLTAKGSPMALKSFLDFGAGQNTGAGAGMLWEV